MSRIAMLSVHGCPLARLGTHEAGGMQLYVRALSRELGERGLKVDVEASSHDIDGLVQAIQDFFER